MMEQPRPPSSKEPEADHRSESERDPSVGERRVRALRATDTRPDASAAEAIERATAALGDDEENR